MQKRPSDTTIRASRIIFGLILSGALYYNLIIQGDAIQSNLFWIDFTGTQIEYLKYILVCLGLFPIYMGIANVCLMKKKYVRIAQIIMGIILFYVSHIIVEGPSLDVDSLILLMGFFPLAAGITGKCITSKCLRFGEPVTKIRV